VINKLLLQVNKDYLDWAFTAARLRWHEESLQLAGERFEAIRQRVLFGDQPGIDSLEALIEVQNRENIRNQSQLELNNARLMLSNHLWDPEGRPVDLAADVDPTFDGSVSDTVDSAALNALLDSANSNHPELVKLRVKLQQLEIEKRWAAEKLRPKLNLDYNFLAPRADGLFENGLQPIYRDNYKMGVSFSMPLFLREERGKLNLMKIKLNQTEQEQLQTNREIANNIRAAYNELTNLSLQLRIQEQQLENAENLLACELYRFENGESFLFLVNNRENAVINSRIKLAELRAKYGKSRAYLDWAAGSIIAK
jgi:outer membrane protein TolC